MQPPGQAHSSVAAFLPAHAPQCWAALPASHCCRYVSFWLAMFPAPMAWKVQGARAPRCRRQTRAALALPTAMRTQTLRYQLLQCYKHGQRQIVGAAVTSRAHWWRSLCLHLDNLAFLIYFFFTSCLGFQHYGRPDPEAALCALKRLFLSYFLAFISWLEYIVGI